ncbi:hypothetical protein C7H79_03860 [Nitrosomonas supralitoralis]|uniref:Uncharacterized protein n=1 Tax=Nitrosomonas supralitoralis TaxID=2116706 RepID=A0A2P7NXY6_9PROT|nr:hypothetical protein C7H79_03860 [Nitrosomonas supralitoralis]
MILVKWIRETNVQDWQKRYETEEAYTPIVVLVTPTLNFALYSLRLSKQINASWITTNRMLRKIRTAIEHRSII